MVLKLNVFFFFFRNVISFIYEPKSWWNSGILTIFSDFFLLFYHACLLHWKSAILGVRSCFMLSLYILYLFWCVYGNRDPLYYGTNAIRHIWGFSFQVHRGSCNPPWKTGLQKGLGKTKVKLKCLSINSIKSNVSSGLDWIKYHETSNREKTSRKILDGFTMHRPNISKYKSNFGILFVN